MDKMRMQSVNKVIENINKIGEIFPNCLTERKNNSGSVEYAIDFDMLRQELSSNIVEGYEERYQFSWPDKRKAILLANAPITRTLRPVRNNEPAQVKDENGNVIYEYTRTGSVNFDTTENLYIEGDNLDVLKVLQETYLGKIKMIYIDPPYNTGNDFVYEDDFVQNTSDYLTNSGQYNEEGGRMVTNLDSNGRFHTDWLNMMYPRLRLAKDLLSNDGLIFISIGDEEVDNLRNICDEIFGESNFRNQIIIRRGAKSVQAQFDTWDKLGQGAEYILFYSKSATYRFPRQMKLLSKPKPGAWNNHWRGTDRPTMRYPLWDITPKSGQWRWGKERSESAILNYDRLLKETNRTKQTISQDEIDEWYKNQPEGIDLLRLSKSGKPEHYIPPTDRTLLNSLWTDLLVGSSSEISKLFKNKVFDTAKLTAVIIRMLCFSDKEATVLDFFSGSATTAHAVMQLNAEDGGNRKHIMVQIPEKINEKSEAYKSGYKNICEIGKERIRRAGAMIKEEIEKEAPRLDEAPKKVPDIGFRVLKLDSTNMKDVYYNPTEYTPTLFDSLTDNIKEDRTPEDLLFQVMLDLGVLLSSKIKESMIEGKKVFNVADGFLIACFDDNVTDDTVKAIAQQHPYYAVFRDSSYASDSVATNFEQIFATYSPDTVRKVL